MSRARGIFLIIFSLSLSTPPSNHFFLNKKGIRTQKENNLSENKNSLSFITDLFFQFCIIYVGGINYYLIENALGFLSLEIEIRYFSLIVLQVFMKLENLLIQKSHFLKFVNISMHEMRSWLLCFLLCKLRKKYFFIHLTEVYNTASRSQILFLFSFFKQ